MAKLKYKTANNRKGTLNIFLKPSMRIWKTIIHPLSASNKDFFYFEIGEHHLANILSPYHDGDNMGIM